MGKFSQRSNEVEWMDDLNCSGEIVDQTLRELETINKWLGGNHVTVNGIEKLLSQHKTQGNTIKIVDLGCGSGDMLKRIALWAKKKKIDLELIGIDANPSIVGFAEKNTANFPEISYKAINIFGDEFQRMEFDIVTSTLFTHHFTSDELIGLLKAMANRAKLGIVINDLHRHWFAYYSIKLLTKLFSKSKMVQNDAAVSVLRAFKKRDIMDIMSASSLKLESLKWMWAFRWQIILSPNKN